MNITEHNAHSCTPKYNIAIQQRFNAVLDFVPSFRPEASQEVQLSLAAGDKSPDTDQVMAEATVGSSMRVVADEV